jgi:chemotaxis signal transduction protein
VHILYFFLLYYYFAALVVELDDKIRNDTAVVRSAVFHCTAEIGSSESPLLVFSERIIAMMVSIGSLLIDSWVAIRVDEITSSLTVNPFNLTPAAPAAIRNAVTRAFRFTDGLIVVDLSIFAMITALSFEAV